MAARRLAWLLALAACEGAPAHVAKPDAGIFGEQCQPGAAFDINGTAGVLATLNVHINAGGLVDTDAAAELLLLMQVTQTGRDVAVVATPCGLTIPDIPVAGQDRPIHFELPAALIASVEPVAGTGDLDGDRTCATVKCHPITLLIGARMSPPSAGKLPEADATGSFNACLPSTASCYDAITSQCACDQELDGHPGATLVASNVPVVPLEQVYVNLRTTFSLEGQVWSSDRIEGEVVASLEQAILGCGKAQGIACSAGETLLVKNLNPRITQSEQDPSVFRGVRVDDDLTCADLVAMRDVIFGR